MKKYVLTYTVFLSLLWSLGFACEHSLRISRVERIVDGDTIVVDFDNVHSIFGKGLSIRLQGIDAPEKYPRFPYCDWKLEKEAYDACKTEQRNAVCERAMAHAAQQALEAFVKKGTVLMLVNLQRDKYFRVGADLLIDGESASAYMLATGHARPYSGDMAREPWVCEEEGK